MLLVLEVLSHGLWHVATLVLSSPTLSKHDLLWCVYDVFLAGVGVKNFGFTEKQKNIEQGSTKLKELHVCIKRVQKKMAA